MIKLVGLVVLIVVVRELGLKFPLRNVGVLARHVLCVKLDLGADKIILILSFKILMERDL